MNITKSNFSYAISLLRGGSIMGNNANNAIITDCFFDNSGAIGYITPEDKNFGQGGAIYWINSDNLTISNTQFYKTESHSDGAVYLLNCNNSRIYDVLFNGSLSLKSGGSISWINSTNGTVDKCTFINSEATNRGGAINLDRVNNITVKNSKFNGTHTTKDNGGSIYIDGNVTIDNNTFVDFSAYSDWGASLYFHNGTSSVVNSTFNGTDAIWVYRYATVNFTSNNITGKDPNKGTPYLKEDYNSKYNPVDYSVWNDGVIYLKGNNFDYIIFNNGTIKTKTYMDVLWNTTWDEDWNTSFTFFANITDDNNNTIISVSSLSTSNNHPEYGSDGKYNLTYNRITLPLSIQDSFIIYGHDAGLEDCDMRPGSINVRMPTTVVIFNTTDINTQERISFTVKVSVPAKSNKTFDWSKLKVKINGVLIEELIIDGILKTEDITRITVDNKTAYLNFTEVHLPVGTYTITADYEGDDYFTPSYNETSFALFSRDIWLKVNVSSIYYGETLVINVTSNATNTVNGRIRVSINGKEMSGDLRLINGSYIYRLPNENYTAFLEPGMDQIVSVTFYKGTYYSSQTNSTLFNVYKLDTPLTVNYTNITYGETFTVNVTVNETAEGYIALRIGNDVYVQVINHGFAQFNITGLAAGVHNATITFPGDNHFNANATNITFKVNATEVYTFDVKVEDIEFGQNATIRVLVPTNAKGNVTIYVDGESKGTVNITNGTAQLIVSGLAGGNHTVNVTYNGDSTYAPGYKNNTVFKVKATNDWDMTITGNYKPYGENSTITVKTKPYELINRYVNITIDNVSYIRPLDINGTATLTLNNLSAGSHNASVSYVGDDNYAYKIKEIEFVIPKATPSIKITQIGTDLIATVGGNATGYVTFTINNRKVTVPLVGRNATLIGNLTVGVNYVGATYNGDGNYTTAETAGIYTIDKYASLVNVTAENTPYGETVEITVKVGPGQTGIVKITVNGKSYMDELVDQEAKFYVDGLNVNSYTVNVHYYGDDLYSAQDNSTTFNVTKTVMDANVTALNVTVEENTSFIINVLNDFKGNVSISVGTTLLYNGTVKNIVTGNILPIADDHTATVVFYGDSKYDKLILDNVNFTVSRVTPTINVVISDTTYPANATATINVGNNANGTVNVTVGTQVFDGTVTNGVAIVNLTGLSGGVKEAIVEFFATDAYNNNLTSTATFTVNKNTSSIEIGVDAIYKVGQNIVIELTTFNSTGAIKVTINGANYTVGNDNKVTITGGLPEGTYIVNAVLAGDNNYNGSSDTKTFTVVKNNITIDVSEITSPIYVGNEITFTAQLNQSVTGIVVFNINGANYTVYISNADVATYKYTPVNNETLTVVATFTGNDKFNSNSSSPVDFIVNRNSDIEINVTVNSPIFVGENAVIAVEMTPSINTTVQVEVNGKTYDVAIVKGKGSLNVSGLLNGAYDVNVTFAGDNKYSPANATKKLYVNKITDYSINVTATNITVGQNATITVVLPADVNANNLTIRVNELIVDFTMVNGIATAIVPNLAIGNYKVNVTYATDGKYSTKYNNGTPFRVTGTDVYAIILDVENHTYGENTTFTVILPKDVVNNVAITVDGISYNVTVNTTGDMGIATLRLNNLSGGLHAVSARYLGDDKYLELSNSTTFTVAKAATSISVDDIDAKFVGESATITVRLPQHVNGTVTLHVDDNNYTVAVHNGVGTYTISDLVNKTYSISASFAGDVNFTGSTTADVVELVVNKIPTIISVVISDDDIRVNESTVVNITLNQAINTTVVVKVNGKEYIVSLTEGEGNLTLSGLAADAYVINATFAENDKYLGNVSNNVELTVNRIATGIVVVASPISYGNEALITVTMNPSINASVIVRVNNKNYTVAIVNGQGKLNVSGLNVGSYGVNVTYAGDNSYLGSQKNATLVVNPKDLTADVVAQNVTVKQNTSFIVSVPDDFKGNVSITVEGQTLYNATAKEIINVAKLLKGDKVADVVFYGDNNYNRLPLTVDFVVSGETPVVSIDVTEVTYPGTPIAKVNISNKASGIVNITIDGKNFTKEISGGYVEIPLGGLNATLKNATIEYISDDGYNDDVTVEYQFVINQADSHIDINVTPSVIYVGGRAFLNITVSCTGDVIIYVDGKEYVEELDANSKVYVTTDPLSAGQHSVVVYYPGDVNYKPSSASKNFTVDEGNFIVESTGYEYVTLAEAVENSALKDTITGRPGVYTGEGNIGVTISGKELTIKGEDVVFDAENANVNILTVNNDANVTLIGLTYANVDSTTYGAVVDYGNLTVVDCKFVNNSAKEGGAIYVKAASLTVVGSNFTDNNATTYGGAIRATQHTSLTISDSVFVNNGAIRDGGAISANSGKDLVISGSNFTDNVAYVNGDSAFGTPYGGGAVYYYGSGNVSVSDSRFVDNVANSNKGLYPGAGALYLMSAKKLEVIDCEFDGNNASRGGAIYYKANNGQLFVSGSNFTSNNGTLGGAIYTYLITNVTIDNSRFEDNSAVDGGAMYLYGTSKYIANVNIAGSEFLGNVASGNGDAIYLTMYSKSTIKDSVFTDNGDVIDYAIYNLGNLSLENNNVDNIIYNGGNIISQVNSTVLGNDTYDITVSSYNLNATLVDDMGNKIYDPNFRFTVNGEVVDVVPDYNKETGIYNVTYALGSERIYVVDVTSDGEE
jgi:predicted outer membrane repeat protein